MFSKTCVKGHSQKTENWYSVVSETLSLSLSVGLEQCFVLSISTTVC